MNFLRILGVFFSLLIFLRPTIAVGQCSPSGNTYLAVAGNPQQTLEIANGDEIWFQWPAGSSNASISMFPSASVDYYLYDGLNGALLGSGSCGGSYFTYNCGSVPQGYYVIFRACGIPAGQSVNFLFVEALSGGPLALVDNRLTLNVKNEGIEIAFHPTAESITTIYRSSNGLDFEKIATTKQSNYVDKRPLIGPNYYWVENEGDKSKIAVAYWTGDGPLRIISANPLPVGYSVIVNANSKIFFTDINGREFSNPVSGVFCVWIIEDNQRFYVGRQIFL